MRTFDSISEGLSATKRLVASQNRKVGALLTFQESDSRQCQTCFLFESVEDRQSQLIKQYPESLKLEKIPPAEMSSARAARDTVMSVVLAGVDHDHLGVRHFGHAEEFLIRGFDAACGQVGSIKSVVIYLSHSPCTEHDSKPSSSLTGWPRSCLKKLAQLAASRPAYSFSVVYWSAFGFLQGQRDTEKVLGSLSGNMKNLHFIGQTGS